MNHGKDSQERNQPLRNWDIGRMCVCVCVWVGVLFNDPSNDKLFDQWWAVKDLEGTSCGPI